MRYRYISILAVAIIAAIIASVEVVNSITIKIEYQYNSLGICIKATARGDGLLLGKADMTHLEKGKYIEVKEIHYSADGTGRIIYEAISKFSIPLGMKIAEEKIFGKKMFELFSSWPI